MSPAANPLSLADQALLATQRGWSEVVDDRFWNCFEPGWRRALQEGWTEITRQSPDEARVQVRREHQAQAHPDWSRIHPTWWLRALKDETPAVQRAVIAHVPEAIRPPLLAQLGLSDEDRSLDLPPLPEALNAALAVWAERLVGDWPDRDDFLVIQAITRLDLSEVTQLMAAAGLAKATLAGASPVPAEIRSSMRALPLKVQTAFAASDDRLRSQAEQDVAPFGPVKADSLGSIGLVTFARLLASVETYRVRWALQHLPYKVAKLLRALMARSDGRDAEISSGEHHLLEIAWDHLLVEGRIRIPRRATP